MTPFTFRSTRLSFWILRVALLTLMLALLGAGPVSMPLTCVPGNVFIYDGTDPNSTYVYGVRSASINTRNPPLCVGTEYTTSSIWVMITNGQGGCDAGWAQVGYIRARDESQPQYFTEYKRGCGYAVMHQQHGVATGSHNYRVLWNTTTGFLKMKIDKFVKISTNFDPTLVWPAMRAQWEGETHDDGSDIAGTLTDPVYFSGMGWRTTPGRPWVIPTGLTVSSDITRYDVAWDTQNQTFHVWTK